MNSSFDRKPSDRSIRSSSGSTDSNGLTTMIEGAVDLDAAVLHQAYVVPALVAEMKAVVKVLKFNDMELKRQKVVTAELSKHAHEYENPIVVIVTLVCGVLLTLGCIFLLIDTFPPPSSETKPVCTLDNACEKEGLSIWIKLGNIFIFMSSLSFFVTWAVHGIKRCCAAMRLPGKVSVAAMLTGVLLDREVLKTDKKAAQQVKVSKSSLPKKVRESISDADIKARTSVVIPGDDDEKDDDALELSDIFPVRKDEGTPTTQVLATLEDATSAVQKVLATSIKTDADNNRQGDADRSVLASSVLDKSKRSLDKIRSPLPDNEPETDMAAFVEEAKESISLALRKSEPNSPRNSVEISRSEPSTPTTTPKSSSLKLPVPVVVEKALDNQATQVTQATKATPVAQLQVLDSSPSISIPKNDAEKKSGLAIGDVDVVVSEEDDKKKLATSNEPPQGLYNRFNYAGHRAGYAPLYNRRY